VTDSGRQLARFAIAGVAGLAVDVAVLYLALALGCGAYGGRVVSFLCAVFATWQINRRYTFHGAAAGGLWREWWRYLTAMTGGGLVNYATYAGAIAFGPRTPWWPFVAVAAGSLAGMTVNFASAKFFVFKR
jgi:putative flippase GtrA